MVLDRSDAIAAWRRAEARVYPSVMVNAALYQQYVATVRAVAEELADVRTEDDLVAAFCHRHRQITREQGKAIARARLEEARRTGAEWVVLFDDVTPLGSQRLEMHVRTGRALHTSSRTELDSPIPSFELEVVQLDPATGAWLVDQAPLMSTRIYHSHEEWEARIAQARATF